MGILRFNRLLAGLAFGSFAFAAAQTIDPSQLAGLKWRCIGPFRGGRVSAVAGVIGQYGVYYIGLPQGGVWKTTSAGSTWYPVFDSIKDVCSVGSVQVAPSDPNVVYAGTGEISGGGEGNGIYKSIDAGKTWQHIGLDESEQINAILVDPHNPNLVLAAAIGQQRILTEQRGVFRSTDGGKSWSKTLFVDNKNGVQHMAWAFDNPGVVFALTAEHYQAPPPPGGNRQFKPPAPGAIYKSADEGATWKKLKTVGLPMLNGHCEMAVAQGAQSQRVFLIGAFGLYRSDDGGTNWRRMAANDSRIANGQGGYNCGVFVDSKNPDVVYTINTCSYRSVDGGKTFEAFKGAPGGDDPHDMWIDPNDGNRILLGGDQGAVISEDGGQTWGSWYNQPTAQVYHIAVDNRYPYWVYATQQDSGCVETSSRGNLGAITPMDWRPNPGFEFGTVIPDPLNPAITYAWGPTLDLIRITNTTGQWVDVQPILSSGAHVRASFGKPMMFDPKNPHELLVGFERLMSTTDGGVHWKELSPDLTIRPSAKPAPKGQPNFSSIESISPSTVAHGTIWAATNNGLIKVTKDRGTTWEDASISKQANAPRSGVNCIDSSHQDPATAYASVAEGNGQDPHFYRTHDYGATWTPIDTGLPKGGPGGSSGNVIRADTMRAGLLFAGTAKAVYVSFDDGDHWQSLMLNMPTTIFNDLVVHGNDLVAGTYGRGLWILDDISPLRQISAAAASEPAHLYKPGEAIRVRRNANGDTPFPPEVPHAPNPPLGAVIYYSLQSRPAGEVKLEILDAKGHVIRHMSSAPIEPYDDPAPPVPAFWVEGRKPLPTEPGLNRVNWNIRHDTPPAFNHDVGDVMGAMEHDTPAAIEGPLAPPGRYTVRLTVDGKTYEQPLTVKNDPRSSTSDSDVRRQHELLAHIYEGIQESWDGYLQVSAMKSEVASILAAKPADEVVKGAKAFDDKLSAIGGKLVRERRFSGPPPPTNFVNLNEFLLAQLDSLDYGDMAPTDSMLTAYGSAWSKLKAVADKWRALNGKDLNDFNALLVKRGLKPISAATGLVDPQAPSKRYLPRKGG